MKDNKKSGKGKAEKKSVVVALREQFTLPWGLPHELKRKTRDFEDSVHMKLHGISYGAFRSGYEDGRVFVEMVFNMGEKKSRNDIRRAESYGRSMREWLQNAASNFGMMSVGNVFKVIEQ